MKYVDLCSRFNKPHMKNPVKNERSIATCYGLIEMQRHSISLQSWMDWDMEITEEKVDFNSVNPSLIGTDCSHTFSTNGWADKNNIVIAKISPPFAATCKDDIDFVMASSPFLKHNLHIPSGMVNFRYTNSFAFFIYLHKEYLRKWDFAEGDSLINLAPMSDRPIKVHNYYDPSKYHYYTNKTQPTQKAHSFYKRRKRLMDNT